MKLIPLILAMALMLSCKKSSDVDGIVIRNGVVLTMNKTHDVIVNGTLVIKGSRIIAIGTEDTIKHYPGFKVIDADGGIIMPGLINTHSHLPMIAFRGLAENGVTDRLFNYFLPLEKNMLSRELIYNATIQWVGSLPMQTCTTIWTRWPKQPKRLGFGLFWVKR